MKKYRFGIALAFVAGMMSSLAQAATTYASPHGALIAGEASLVDNAGARIFFPASVGGTLEASPTGAQVKEDAVQYNATYKAGLQVRSTLYVAPRSGMSNLYIDASNRAYLTGYDAYLADGSNNTSVNSQPVLLDAAKYPGLTSATRLFPTYGGASVSSTYYLSGTNLYRTTALRPGTANSATAALIDTGVLDVVGVDGGVFVRTGSGVTFYDVAGGAAGLSAIINPSISSAEFKSITAVHDSYYVMVLASGDHQVFKIDGTYNYTITGTNKIGFVPYVNRSAQVAGHNGQTTFAWYTADYKISYIDPYVAAASAIKSIDWSGAGGTKQNRANTIKFLSVSEDGFVQYTGKNSSSSAYYLMIAANAATMTNVSSISSATASDASNSSAASVVWNNPSNANWHYKVPSATFGSTGTKTYYWKWGLSGGKVVLTRASTSSAVVSYTGSGRICRLSSQYYVVPNSSSQTGTGTTATSIAGPLNPCGTSAVTLVHANAADLAAGYVPVGSVDGSYIDSSANYVRTGSMSDLSTVGAPSNVSGTMNPPAGFTGVSGWDPRQSMMFGIDGSGVPYMGGNIFSATAGSSQYVNFPFANDFTATASSAASPTTVTLNWNDPRDSRAGVTTWNVTTSRLVAAVPNDTVTQPGSPSSRAITLDPLVAGYSQNYSASAELTVPVIGHRGAKITVSATNFTGTLDQPPVITNPGTTQVNANASNFLVPLVISDPDVSDTLNLTVSSPPSHGAVTVNSGKYYYTPALNYIGTDQFTAQVTDVAGATAVSNVMLNVVCPDPVISGMTLATSQDGPYRGTTATLAYSSNTCNGGLPVTFTVKDSHGTVVGGTTQVVTATDGTSQTKAYTFTDIPPGVHTVNAHIQSNNRPAFTSDITAATNYTSAPTAAPTLGSNKTTPTEDDEITVTASALPLCPYYDNVTNARVNKGCFIEWTTSAGVLSSTNPAANQLKVISLRGAQTVTATVKAYNTDGTNSSLDPVVLPMTIAAPVDVVLNHTFSKGGAYAQYTDNVGITFTGDVANQCQVAATDAQAQTIVDGGNHACTVQFTQIPSGLKQATGALSLSGRLLNGVNNTVAYSIYRYYAPGVRTLINSDSFSVPTAASSYTSSTSISVASPGYGVELNVANGSACAQTAVQADAKASWNSVGQAKCLVEWTSIPAGLSNATVNSKPGISGTPTSSSDQAVSYKVYLVDDSDTKIEIASGSGVVVDHAPAVTLPISTVQIDTDSANAAIPSSGFSDSDAGDVVSVSILTAAQHGTASYAGGVLKYQPAPSYIGPDSFTIKVSDKYGVSKTGTVDISVICGMPNLGGVTTPNVAGFWENRPVDIAGKYSPAHSCHGGFTTHLEIVDSGNIVVKQITAPTSMTSSTDVNGQVQNNPVYDNVTLPQGTYTARLRIQSLADGSKEVVIPGDQMIVVPVSSPSLSVDKLTPTEDDDITVSATAMPLCPYYSTVADARVNKGCFIEWTGSAGVMTATSIAANQVKVAAVQGSQSVTALVKAYDTDGSYFSLPSVTLPVTVSKAVDVNVNTTFSKAGSYTQYIDNASATFAAAGGTLCSLHATETQAQVDVDAGLHACVLEFTGVPTGMSQVTNTLKLDGRLVSATGNDVAYRVARYYAPGKMKIINSGTATFSTAPFAPTVAISINQEDITGTPGYSVNASVSNGPWNCVQTGVNADAKASWSAIGEPKCLVEWSNIPSGLALTSVAGKPGVKGVPLTEGDQKISYAVSLVNGAGQKFALGSATNTVIDHAPTIVVPASFEVDTDSAQATVSGISITESDANDVATMTISTQAQHGTAVYSAGDVKYQPVASFVGSDTFVIKGTDKYGVSSSKSVLIDVSCGMPTIGSIITPNASGFWEVKPQNITANFSPTHSCHSGYQAKLELVNSGGSVVKQIDAPTTQMSSTDGFGNEQRSLSYNNVSFDAGTYSTRLRIRSNAFPAKEVLLAGDEFVVQNVPSPTLVADKTSPSEDDVVTITASHNGCSSFANSASEAVANNNCYIEWTKTGTVYTMTRKGVNAVEITAQRGVGSVRATIRIPDSSGTLRAVAYADHSTSFNTGISAPIVSASFPQAKYVQIVDYVTGGPIVENGGYDCQLVATQAQGQTIAVGGGRACLMNYTGIPAGMNITPNGVTFEGRIINSNDKTFTYTLARVYADGSTAPVPGGQFVVPVTPMSIKATVQTSKIAYAAGIQDALVSLKLDDVSANSVSCSQTATEAEAIGSWNNAGVPKCLVTWTTIPNGLAVDSNTHTTLVGTPTAVTGNEVAYTVDFVDTYGTHYQALSGTGNLIVRTPVSPTYMMSAKNGTFVPDDGTDPYFLVGDDGIAGVATVTGGDFANIHVLIRDVIGMTNKTTEVADQPSGSKVSVKVATDVTNAWSTRNVSMSLGYEGLGDLLVNNVNVRVMRMPTAAMKVSVTTPKSVVDTASFKVTLKTGELDGRNVMTYNRDKHGLWRAYLAEKNGLGALTPITQEIDISANDGSAVFDGLQANTLQGKTIVGVVVPNVPGGTLNGVTYSVMSDPLAITFIPGGELPATIKASRTSGSIPLGVRFDVVMDFSYRDDVGSVGWEYQLNGSDWISMTGIRGFTANYTFQEGGVYNVRAVITNKNTMVITQTSPIAVTVKQALKLTLTPNSLALPGTDVTMDLSGTKPDGTPISYVNEWEIFRQGQPSEVVTNQSSYVFHSDTPQIINIKIKARPSELPAEDPESWVSVSRTVQFAIPDKPRASITGPAAVEAGVPLDFTVKVVPSWDPKVNTSLTIAGKWILPDGTEIPGTDKLTWAPNPEDVVSGGQIMKLKYAAWVVGAEAQTTWIVEKKISARKYEFPTQKLNIRADTTYAPAFVTLTAIPATAADVKLMTGKKLTYTWTVPDGVTAKASGVRLVGTIDMPGTYTFGVTISDTRGNEQYLEYTFEIIQSRPFNLTVKATLAQKYNRPPAKYGLRVELSGGHPKDHVKNYSTFVDGVKVLDSGARAPALVTIQSPGDHEIKVRMESALGIVVEAATSVSVNANVAPTCNPTVTWDSRGKYCTVKTNCLDSDGLVRSYAWYVDDVLQVGKLVPNFTWIVPDGVTSGTIKFIATDDGGDNVTMDVPVSRP